MDNQYEINTLFYFVDTAKEYRDLVKDGKISPQTIVFVSNVREIYVNGRAYGKTSTAGLVTADELNFKISEINDKVDKVVEDAVARDELIRDELNVTADELNFKISEINDKVDKVVEDAVARDELIRDELNVTADELLSDLNKLFTFVGDGIEAGLDAKILGKIDNDQALISLKTSWGAQHDNVLEWMASGFVSQAQQGGSFAAIYSADKTATTSSIAAVQTSVNNLGDTYVAKAYLGTEMESKLGYALSGIATKSYADSAVSVAETNIVNRFKDADGKEISLSGLLSKVDSNGNAINDLTTSVKGADGKLISSSFLLQESTKAAARLSALATYTSDNGLYEFKGGVITESNKDSAMASLLAEDSNTKAAVTALVENGTSNLVLSADKIHLEGYTTINRGFSVDLSGNMYAQNGVFNGTGSFKGDVIASSFTTQSDDIKLNIKVTTDSVQFRDGTETDTVAPMGKAYFSIDTSGQFRLNIWNDKRQAYYVPNFLNWSLADHTDILQSESLAAEYYLMSDGTDVTGLTNAELKNIYNRYVNFAVMPSSVSVISKYKAEKTSKDGVTSYSAGEYCSSATDALKYNDELFLPGASKTTKLNDSLLCKDGLLFSYNRPSGYRSTPTNYYDSDLASDIADASNYIVLTDSNTTRYKDTSSSSYVWRWYYNGQEMFWQEGTEAAAGRTLKYNNAGGNYTSAGSANNIINLCTCPEHSSTYILIDPVYDVYFDAIRYGGEDASFSDYVLYINKFKFEKAYNS